MKKTFTIITLLIAGTIAFSQQLHLTQFATLNHNDTVTAYYGPDAFVSAHSAAVHGDIITLSSGSFESPFQISKAITIRGAGMMKNINENRSEVTQVDNNFYIDVPDNQDYQLTIEGVYFTGCIIYRTAYNPQFHKCRFSTIRRAAYVLNPDDENVVLFLPVFNNCIIGEWDGSSKITNPIFINSVILSCMQGWSRAVLLSERYIYEPGRGYYQYYDYECTQSYDTYFNCIVNISPSHTNNKRNIINSITYSTSTSIGDGNNVYNTLGITDSTDFYSISNNHDNHNVNGFESIFKTFRGTYTEGEMFELTDEAAATYLGSDGTQVGIYGGSAVFNPKATDMRIRKYSVGFYSDGNGQLKITTELENE